MEHVSWIAANFCNLPCAAEDKPRFESFWTRLSIFLVYVRQLLAWTAGGNEFGKTFRDRAGIQKVCVITVETNESSAN
jgi:hypothetical protein